MPKPAKVRFQKTQEAALGRVQSLTALESSRWPVHPLSVIKHNVSLPWEGE
jgi:hypothetical protein